MSEESKVVEVTDETFESEVKGQEGWCVVDFYATWCPHCKAFRPTFEEVAAECALPVRFYAADVERTRAAAKGYGFRSIPTVVILQDGEHKDTHVGGMSADELRKWIEEQVGG